MPQSLSLVIVHLIFSTKNRCALIGENLREPLHAYLATVARNAGCDCYRVGGTEDHVHCAIELGRTITVAALVEELKTSSSRWVKGHDGGRKDFAWQRGYGCFSVSPKHLGALRDYIDAQADHHRSRSFEDEFRGLMKKCGVEYDEKYVWD